MKVFKSNKPRVQFNWFFLNESVGTFEHSVISFPNSRNSYWNVLSICKGQSKSLSICKVEIEKYFYYNYLQTAIWIKENLKIILVSFSKKQKPR